MENGQNISIGLFCDRRFIVEHEILHALGFFHEQSRYDRDDFLTIQFQNILEGLHWIEFLNECLFFFINNGHQPLTDNSMQPENIRFIQVCFFCVCVHVGREFNFEKVPKILSTDNGVPYDYLSVMHYGKNAFSNGNGSTIVTKDPKFQDIIGQTYGMSPKDILELNRLYKCSECCCGGSLNSHGVK